MPIAFVNLVGEEDSYHRRGEDENVKVRTESKSNLKEAMKVVRQYFTSRCLCSELFFVLCFIGGNCKDTSC